VQPVIHMTGTGTAVTASQRAASVTPQMAGSSVLEASHGANRPPAWLPELAMTRWNYTKGTHDLGNGAYAYLQPDEGSGWGWSNGGLIVDGKESLLVDTLRDEKLTRAML